MKRLIKPALAVLFVVLAVIIIVNFKSELREVLGAWYKLIDLFLHVSAPLSIVWMMVVVASMGRKDSKVLPNGDRTAGINAGSLTVVTIANFVAIPLFAYAGFVDPKAPPISWATVAFWGIPSVFFLLAAIAAWQFRLTWNSAEIRSRTLLGRKSFDWAGLLRIEDESHTGGFNLMFNGRKKLEVVGFLEALDELRAFAESKVNDA